MNLEDEDRNLGSVPTLKYNFNDSIKKQWYNLFVKKKGETVMRHLVICMCKYCYFGFRKFCEGLFGMPTCRPEVDAE